MPDVFDLVGMSNPNQRLNSWTPFDPSSYRQVRGGRYFNQDEGFLTPQEFAVREFAVNNLDADPTTVQVTGGRSIAELLPPEAVENWTTLPPEARTQMLERAYQQSVDTRPRSTANDLLRAGALAYGGVAAAGGLGFGPLSGGGAAETVATTGTTAGTTAGSTAGTTAGSTAGTAAGSTTASSLPSWVGPAIGAGASLIGAGLSADAASDAVDAQLQGTREGLEYLTETRDIALEQAQPFYDASVGALSDMESLMSGEYDITQDPSYQFRLDEGMRAVENSAFAR